ncbi:hypothetical protein LINPERHAP2_LOCUS17095 [Linum perenne]
MLHVYLFEIRAMISMISICSCCCYLQCLWLLD